jgi:small conductance mechanosensitive channel
MILTFRPFKVGDYVELGGTAGTVKEVGVFSSTLATPDNVQVTVPNSRIYGETIKNYSANPTRRIDLVVGVGYDDDLNVAIETIHQVLSTDERILAEPEPVVAVSEMADSSVNFRLRFWLKNPHEEVPIGFEYQERIKKALDQAGIEIPYPHMSLFVERLPAARAGPAGVGEEAGGKPAPKDERS